MTDFWFAFASNAYEPSFGTDSDSLLLSILTHSIFAMAGITYF